MPAFGLPEILIMAVCCLVPVIALLASGLAFGLLKWGVIASYWLKDEAPPNNPGDYTLDQSRDVSQ